MKTKIAIRSFVMNSSSIARLAKQTHTQFYWHRLKPDHSVCCCQRHVCVCINSANADRTDRLQIKCNWCQLIYFKFINDKYRNKALHKSSSNCALSHPFCAVTRCVCVRVLPTQRQTAGNKSCHFGFDSWKSCADAVPPEPSHNDAASQSFRD